MFGDAIKRLEYAVKQRPEVLVDQAGEPTRAYWALFETIYVMLHAIGEDALADKLERLVERAGGAAIDLFQVLRDHGVGDTPYDKLIPWTYRVLRQPVREVEELARRGAAIMQWQAATRTDINKLSVDQVFAAVDKWANAPKPAKHVGKIIYQFRDGWTVQQLDADAALKEEGRLLKHCVGGYCKQVAAGTSVIYSLRDPANVPRITLELNPKTNRFVQIHGPENAAPTPDVQPYLVEVITQVFDREPFGLLLTGAPVKSLDLRGADLRGADLRWAWANLTGADLTDADLTDANLTDANLTDANLRGADLTGAYLPEATLTRADLTDADLTGALLVGANLTGADLTSAILAGALLTWADLRGADLTGADLTGAGLIAVKFDETTTMPGGSKWRPEAGLGRRSRRF